MSIFVIGINHKTAPIALREKIYFATEKLPLYLQDLANQGYTQEAVLLSTCNRSELYCETNEITAIYQWFCAQTNAERGELESAIYLYSDEEAVTHLMQVACGLDSMVLGEPQILGQLKDAYSESCTVGTVGAIFHQLFQQVFACAKEIRSTTAVGACPVSVASAAAHFAKQQAENFTDSKVLLVGAGDTTDLLMRYLRAHLTHPMMVVNRSLEKAQALTEQTGGEAYGLDKLVDALHKADIVFSATGSAIPVVTKEIVMKAMQARENRPLILIDIAVPRDIEPTVAEIANVHLYCIDDLKAIIEKNRLGREHAADKAREMIRKRSREFMHALNSSDKVTHTIRAYRGQIEEICRVELSKAKQQLHQGNDAMQVLDAFASAYTKKLLHTPSVQLRQAGAEGRFDLLSLAKQLFAIPDSEIERL